MKLLAFLRLTAVAFTLAAATSAAGAADYPTRPVRIVVGYAAGGATDVVARLLAQKLNTQTGQQFVVENKAGANGNIAADQVARSTPDGYTLYLGAINNTINASLYNNLPFEFMRDFAGISLLATIPNVLVVHPSVKASNVKEFIQLAKDSSSNMNFASSGSGSSIHMSGELFKMMTGTAMTHVPYKGSAPAVTDLLGGSVQCMFDNLPSAIQHIKAGKLRPLAVTGAQRSPVLPDVPTMIEAGVADYVVNSWFGLFAPAKVPGEIIRKLNEEVRKALNSPDMQDSLAKLGATANGTTPEELNKFVAAETSKWAKVVKASGAKVD